MDEVDIKGMICSYINEICHYSQMQVFATSYYQKNYFQMQIDDMVNNLICLYQECNVAVSKGSIQTIMEHYIGETTEK